MSNDRLPRDGVTLVLLAAVVMISGVGLAEADWVDHLIVVPAVGVLGVLAGTALAWSRFGPNLASLFAVVYGVFTVGWQVGQVADPSTIWQERISGLAARLWNFARVVVRGDTNQDMLMFVVLMAVLFWILGVQAGWAIFRRQGLWRATLPPALVLLVNAFYYVGPTNFDWYIGSTVLLVLLLALRMNLLQRRVAWRVGWAQVPPGASQMIGRVGLAVAVAMVFLAWGGPAFAQSTTAADLWLKLSKPWETVRERIGDAFGRLRSPLVVVSDVYGATLSLSAGVEPGDLQVLDVEVDREPGPGGRFYWRSRAFDHYEAGQWSTTVGEAVEFRPESGNFGASGYAGRETASVTVIPHVPALRALYLPSQPLWVNRPALVTEVSLPSGSVDILSVGAESVVVEGETYRARGSLAVPTADQLEAAGEDYPAWVSDTYLQIPESISPRVFELAHAITADLATPYQKAVAITSWLRRNLTYSRVTEPPPADAEPIEWLLFDYGVGFCDYYASAEVILLRAAGVPARMAAGYASGQYDADSRTYEVRAGDAHAWPEVFFPGLGWVEFEPTAEQPALVRPTRLQVSSGMAGAGGDFGGQFDEGFFEGRTDQEFFPGGEPVTEGVEATPEPGASSRLSPWWVLGAMAVVAIGVAIALAADPYLQAVLVAAVARRVRRPAAQMPRRQASPLLAAATPTAQTYLRWNLWLARLRLDLQPAQTPFERAAAFSDLMPEGREAAWAIAEAYAAERFGGRAPDGAAVRQAWRFLYPRVWLAWLQRSLEWLRDPRRNPRKRKSA